MLFINIYDTLITNYEPAHIYDVGNAFIVHEWESASGRIPTRQTP